MRRVMRLLPVAVFAVVVAALAASRGEAPGERGTPRVTSVTAPTAGAALPDATELRPVQTDAGTSAPGGERPVSTTPAEGQESPNESPVEGRTSETSAPRNSRTAGPPISYTDPADDANGAAWAGDGAAWAGDGAAWAGDGAADAALSQPAFDILQVRWAPAGEVDEQRRGYSSSIMVAGAARNDGAYVTYGDFRSDVPGERCQLYNILTPGITAFANVFCGSVDNGTRRFIGSVRGSQVTSTRTAAGGTLLIATFDDSALPPLLEAAGRMLFQLSAFTCAADPEGPAAGLRCGYYEILDEANTFNSYRL